MRLLGREFRRRGPWVTRFDIDGQRYGGSFHAEADDRLRQFLQTFPRPGRVLELGCLEGGHTFPLARVADQVVAIDARAENLARARWLNQRVYRRNNIEFVQADLENADLSRLGAFDVVFNVGLLYHLPAPWLLLAKLAPLTQAMLIWTHVANDADADTQEGGYRGLRYMENGMADPLSGTSAQSFWPTLDELERMLADAGFVGLQRLDWEPAHVHGPAVLLCCRSTSGWTDQAGLADRIVFADR